MGSRPNEKEDKMHGMIICYILCEEGMVVSPDKYTLSLGLHENLTLDKISVPAFCKLHKTHTAHFIDAPVLKHTHTIKIS